MESKSRTKLLKNEVAKLFNTSRETLRHYEDMGLISPESDDKGYRLYGVDEMKLLRKIFMFRDLDISLEDMRGIITNAVSKEDYLDLLDEHKDRLKETIARYEETLKNVEQVLELSNSESGGISFKITNYPERFYLTFNPFETQVFENLKTYYDYLREVIESPYYSERELLSIFKYDSLSDFDLKESSICISVDKSALTKLGDVSRFNIKTLEEGTYLSVYYIFEEGRFKDLRDLKNIIDSYMEINNFTLNSEEAIEVEHPELSTHLPKESSIYEIQIKVEQKIK